MFVREKRSAVRDGVNVFRGKMPPFRFAMAFVRWKRTFVCVKICVVRVGGDDLLTEAMAPISGARFVFPASLARDRAHALEATRTIAMKHLFDLGD